jgi:hypothetical protein
MRSSPILPMFNFMEEVAALKLALATPKDAALAFASLLDEPITCRTFDTMQKLALAGANLHMPQLHSTARTAILWASVLPHLMLTRLPAGETVFVSGEAASSAHWLLAGMVRLTHEQAADVADVDVGVWESFGMEAMYGKPYRYAAKAPVSTSQHVQLGLVCCRIEPLHSSALCFACLPQVGQGCLLGMRANKKQIGTLET